MEQTALTNKISKKKKGHSSKPMALFTQNIILKVPYISNNTIVYKNFLK